MTKTNFIKNIIRSSFTILSSVMLLITTSCTKAESEPASDAESITIISGNNQTGQPGAALEQHIEVLVKDQHDKAFAETTVHFSVTEGVASPTSAQTDARGIASTSWTLGQSTGTQTLAITAFKTDGETPLANVPLSAVANIQAEERQEAASLELVSGDNQTGMVGTILNDSIVVLVKDTDGNPFSGAVVNILVNDGSVSNSTITTDANGLAIINWTLGDTIGAQTISVSSLKADGTTPLTGAPLTITANATNEQPVATTLELVSGNNQTGTVNEPLAEPIVMRVVDQFGNPFAGASVIFNDIVSESPFTRTTDANGLVSEIWTLSGLQNTQTYRVSSFSADGTTPLIGSPFTLTATGTADPASADIIVLESGDNQTAAIGTALANPIIVKVLDQFENPFAGVTVNFTTADGSVSASSGVSDANGNVAVNWTLSETEGTQTLTVTAFKADGTTPLSGSPLTVTATGTIDLATAETLELVSGDNQTGLGNMQLENPIVVRVLDQFGNPFSGATVSFLFTGSDFPADVTTDANGLASITWTLFNFLPMQILGVRSYKADGTTPLSGSPLRITATVIPEADFLQRISGDNQSATVNTALANPIIVQVLDQFDNPIAGVTVNFAVNNGSVSTSSGVSDANGNVSVNWMLGATAGTQTLTVTSFRADGTTPLIGSPRTITATGEAAITADILINTLGNNQTGTVDLPLANPVVVRVLDQTENPIAGATVNFATTDGSVSISSGVSDANGDVSVNWTLGETEGMQTLIATSFKADGTTPLSGSPLTINAFGEAAIAADILINTFGNNQTATVGTQLANPIIFRVLDAAENPIALATINFTTTDGFVSADSAISMGNGNVAVLWTLGDTVGTQTMTATGFKADGVTPLEGSPFTITATVTAALSIGDFHAGGVIFYLDSTGESGLVCAVSNQSDNASWGCNGTAISGANSAAIGSGLQNTQAIINGCSESLIAAEYCASLNLNGFTDWFLPSLNELNQLFLNKTIVDATAIANGGNPLDVNFYWSSTQIDASNAEGYNVFGDTGKSNSYAVRAIRAF